MSRVRLINLKSWIGHGVKSPRMCWSTGTTARCLNPATQLPVCNLYKLSWLRGILLSRMKLEVKEHLGLEEKHALHYWEDLGRNGLCPATKLYIPSLCLIFMRFPQYLRFLEGDICLVSLGCILLEVPPIPGCYHSPRVGTLCPLAPFDACHTLMFFSSCPLSLGQAFCELWGYDLIYNLEFGLALSCPWGFFYTLHFFPSLFLSLWHMVTFWYFWQIIKVMIINFRKNKHKTPK